jgi:hypothetical protein
MNHAAEPQLKRIELSFRPETYVVDGGQLLDVVVGVDNHPVVFPCAAALLLGQEIPEGLRTSQGAGLQGILLGTNEQGQDS